MISELSEVFELFSCQVTARRPAPYRRIRLHACLVLEGLCQCIPSGSAAFFEALPGMPGIGVAMGCCWFPLNLLMVSHWFPIGFPLLKWCEMLPSYPQLSPAEVPVSEIFEMLQSSCSRAGACSFSLDDQPVQLPIQALSWRLGWFGWFSCGLSRRCHRWYDFSPKPPKSMYIYIYLYVYIYIYIYTYIYHLYPRKIWT